MSFRDRGREHSKSELRPPDAKRSKGDRPISPAAAQNSNIPVFERRKMFEQTDSGFTFIDKPSIGKRSNRLTVKKGEIGRSGSFRGSKKLKTDVEGSPPLRPKQISSTSLSISQRVRYFGHYDLQSAAIDRLASEKVLASDHAVKKATGASAAHGAEEEEWEDDVCNDLVASCPAFKNEVGGDSDWLSADSAVLRLRTCLSHDKQKRTGSRERFVLDGDIPVKQVIGSRGPMSRQASELFQRQSGIHFPLEFIDYGAAYYRNYFLGQEHQNFFGVDEGLGPVAISLKREKVSDGLPEFYGTPATVGPIGMPKHQYRIILRTSKLVTLRGIVLEDAIPSGTKAGTVKGLPPRDVMEYVGQGELQLSCLKLGKQEKKVYQELVRLDEQELNNKYKIGVLYCKKGQTTEEEMYNNEQGSEAFEQFLALLGNKVKMRGFTKYRAQLDNKTDTTGEYSVYTEFRDAEIMFHISTLLPYTSSNKQQLLRKRHIGNDIVTVIFQEPGCEPFSPRSIRSHFQHIFVVVRVDKYDPQHPKYRVAVARSQDIPYFGPVIPEGAVFDKDDQFKEFLLSKLINACNASLRSEKFSGMAIRTRKQYLTDLAEHCTTGLNIDQANNSGIVGFLARNWGGRKRERIRQQGPLIYTPGGLAWNVSIILRDNKPLPFSEDHDYHLDCILALGPDLLVFLDNVTKETLLYIPTHDICGWLQDRSRLNIFYDDCYCVSLETQEGEEDLKEIASRLQATAPKLTPSHEATLMEFHRGRNGLLGFGINEVGVVQKVDGLAKTVGLQTNSRLLQVEDRLLCCHTHSQIMELLTARHRQFVKAYVVPPPPNTYRRLLHYPAINWNAIWAARPSHNGDLEEQSSVVINEPADPMDTSEQRVQLRSYTRKISNTSRLSYVEAMQSGDVQGSELQVYDDNEPLYDRLMNFNPPDKVVLRHSRPPKSPHAHHKYEENLGYTRVRRAPKAIRESVVQFADDLMERNLGGRWDPEPADHTIDVYSTHVRTQLSVSTAVPGNKPHKAAPLSLSHKRAGSVDQNNVPMDIGSPKSDVPHTPGQVHEIAKRFSFPSPVSTPTGSKGTSKIPVTASHHPSAGTPMKATGTTAEMTKSFVPTKAVSSPFVIPRGDEQPSEGGVQIRSGQRSVKMRPASWDASLIFNADKESIQQTSKDDSVSDVVFDPTQSFTRNSNIRTPFRKKLPSHELSPEPTTTHTTPPHSPEAKPQDSDVRSEEQVQQLSKGSSQGSEKGNGHRISVRERTKRWEARGGGLPSYFATLPKSFRHKASSVSSPPPVTSQSQIPRRNTGTKEVLGRTRNSVSSIPQPVSRIPSPRSSVSQLPSSGSKTAGRPGMSTASKVASSSVTGRPSSTSGKSSPQLLLEEADGSFNPDESLQRSMYPAADEGDKTMSYGELIPVSQYQSGDNSKDLESKNSRVIESPAGRQPVIKTKSITITVGKSRGQSLLPTKTLYPASTYRAVSCERDQTDGEKDNPRVFNPVDNKESSGVVHKGSQPSDRGSNIPRPGARGSSPGHTGVVRRSSAPCPANQQNPSRTIPVPGRDKGSDGHSDLSSSAKSLSPLVAQGSNIPVYYSQKSAEVAATGTSSLENGTDAMDLHMGVQNLSLSDGGREARTVEGPSGSRKPRTAHIEEWIRETNASAVSPEELHSEVLAREIGSPTFTDASLSYSQLSDHSQEVLDSLKQRVEFLESKLEMETENNNELKSQLREMEKQLHDRQNRRNRGIKTAII